MFEAPVLLVQAPFDKMVQFIFGSKPREECLFIAGEMNQLFMGDVEDLPMDHHPGGLLSKLLALPSMVTMPATSISTTTSYLWTMEELLARV